MPDLKEPTKMKTLMLAACLAALLCGPVAAAEQATIADISREGVITLDNGQTYQSNDDLSGWNVGDDVIIPDSDDKMINKDSNNDEIDVDAQ